MCSRAWLLCLGLAAVAVIAPACRGGEGPSGERSVTKSVLGKPPAPSNPEKDIDEVQKFVMRWFPLIAVAIGVVIAGGVVMIALRSYTEGMEKDLARIATELPELTKALKEMP